MTHRRLLAPLLALLCVGQPLSLKTAPEGSNLPALRRFEEQMQLVWQRNLLTAGCPFPRV